MKLTKVRITEFQSIQDSTEFEIDDITCLVGKNEAGKTALLKALYRLNPIVETDGSFDPMDDYPAGWSATTKKRSMPGRREPAIVVRATYALEPDDVDAIEAIFGPECINDRRPTVTLHKGYSNELTVNNLDVDERKAVMYLIQDASLPKQLEDQLTNLSSIEEMEQELANAEQTDGVGKLLKTLRDMPDCDVKSYIFHKSLLSALPKFLYFDEYYQMTGQANIETLRQRDEQGRLQKSDHPLLGLIGLAGFKLDELLNPQRTTKLISRLEGAANRLTDRVLRYWSQNRHLRLKFDVRPAQPGDSVGMTSGTNIWGLVEDTSHSVSTPLGARSRGFIWFFSFLAWYSKLHKEHENIILLLDEPGLSLHAKAQGDLLGYFEKELQPRHQLIYTTHSPFMVDPRRFGRIRIVQDLSIDVESDDLPSDKQGTKVITEVLEATPDSLFPLQGALGYDIHQSLFIGPNCLVVEGVSDLLYIQTMSAYIQKTGGIGLSADWTITPVGGTDKVPTFVALIGAQTNLNVAVLIDFQKKDRQSVEKLYKSQLLQKKKVVTFSQYVEIEEADIEDMFGHEVYLRFVNGAFGSSIEVVDLSDGHPRILRRLQKHLRKSPLPNGAAFNHYRPARYFVDNIESLGVELDEAILERFQRVFDALNRLL